jgi:hypothetical protein
MRAGPYGTWLLVLLLVLIVGAIGFLVTEMEPVYPPLKEADLIFQTSTSNQSRAIFVATGSAYTHMGILKQRGDTWVVIEAAAQVRETPLREWVHRGLFKRVAIYRDAHLSVEQAQHSRCCADVWPALQ